MTLSEYLKSTSTRQADFAATLGVRQSHVSRLCGESPHISPDLAARIATLTDGQVPVSVWPQFHPFAPWLNEPRPSAEAS